MGFVSQSIRATAWLTAVLMPVAGLLYGWRMAMGMLGGATIALANLWILCRFVNTMVSARRVGFWRQLGWWMVKIPLIYGCIALLLISRWSSPVGFLVGFSLWFAVLCFSALKQTVA